MRFTDSSTRVSRRFTLQRGFRGTTVTLDRPQGLSAALHLRLYGDGLRRRRHLIRHDEMVGPGSGQGEVERCFGSPERLPSGGGNCSGIGAPEDVVVVGEQ